MSHMVDLSLGLVAPAMLCQKGLGENPFKHSWHSQLPLSSSLPSG